MDAADEPEKMTMTTLTGHDAIRYAREHSLTLSTYATPVEPSGLTGLTPDQAEAWIEAEPGAGLADLVYVTVTFKLFPYALTDRPASAPLAPSAIRHDADGWHAVYAGGSEPDEQYDSLSDLLDAHELDAKDFEGLAAAPATITGLPAIAYAREHGLTLSTYATDIEPLGLSGLTPDQAEEWIGSEPGAGLADLVWIAKDE